MEGKEPRRIPFFCFLPSGLDEEAVSCQWENAAPLSLSWWKSNKTGGGGKQKLHYGGCFTISIL